MGQFVEVDIAHSKVKDMTSDVDEARRSPWGDTTRRCTYGLPSQVCTIRFSVNNGLAACSTLGALDRKILRRANGWIWYLHPRRLALPLCLKQVARRYRAAARQAALIASEPGRGRQLIFEGESLFSASPRSEAPAETQDNIANRGVLKREHGCNHDLPGCSASVLADKLLAA